MPSLEVSLVDNNWYVKYKIAHRGLHNDTMPENSLTAFQNAIDHGFAIEMDLRLLADGTVVAFHDGNLKRMCGVNFKVEEISKKDLPYFLLDNSAQHIPTLKEILDLVDNQVPLMLELKPSKNRKQLAEAVYKILKKYKGRVAVKSFDPRIVLWFRKMNVKYPIGMLSSNFKTTYAPLFQRIFLKRFVLFRRIKPDFVSYEWNGLPNRFLTKKKLPILTWTIRSEQQEKEVLKYASTVIFENYIPKSPYNY